MNFYLKKIKLWFSTHSEPKEYTFEPNKVNVITGDSSTGKSSILHVIDYCLLARESAIVEDVINENVAWYGLAFHLNGHDYAIARKAPTNGRIGHDYYWCADTDELPGDAYPRPTEGVNRAELQAFISKEFNVPQVTLREGRQTLTPTFREMLLLNYLTEDIIATSGNYFDTQINTDVSLNPFVMKLFKLGLGADEKREQELLVKVQGLEKQINTEQGNKKADQQRKERYERQLQRIREKAEEAGLAGASDDDMEALLQQVNSSIEKFNLLKRSYRKLDKMDELQVRRREIRKELIEYQNLRREYKKAVEYSKMVEDSLRPIEYLEAHLNHSLLGEEAIALYRSLENAFKQAKRNHGQVDELPEGFEQNYRRLKANEKEVAKEIQECNELTSTFFDPNKLMSLVALQTMLKELKPVEIKYCGEVGLNKLNDDLTIAKRELEIVQHENKEKTGKYLEDVQSYYEEQTGMSASYTGCEVDFDEQWRKLILKKNGEYFPIKNVGSKSNHMFMHLCFYLGLHQYLCHQDNSIVPNFLFIDQPSIPYYGNNRRAQQAPGDLKLHKKDDESKLKEAFRLINSFMKQNICEGSGFQIILIEHADPEYWNDLNYFETRYEFTLDKHYGLIPEYVAPLT